MSEEKKLAGAVFQKMMEKDYCSQWMGIELLEIDEGYCRLQMTVRRDMLNGFGILHGGIAYAFADSAFAFASNSYGRVAVSINGSMSFARSSREGEILTAEARALHVTHKTADFDVQINNQAGEACYFFAAPSTGKVIRS